MSRSRRHRPIHGIACAKSEKKDKRLANRRLRRATHVAVATESEPPLLREVSSVWAFGKDGKTYWRRPEAQPKLDIWLRMMRK